LEILNKASTIPPEGVRGETFLFFLVWGRRTELSRTSSPSSSSSSYGGRLFFNKISSGISGYFTYIGISIYFLLYKCMLSHPPFYKSTFRGIWLLISFLLLCFCSSFLDASKM